MTEQRRVKYVDLFCGMGSFHYSFQKLGFKCVFACDSCEAVRNTYKYNYGLEVAGNICDVDPDKIEPYDILTAGVPCQPFSKCGFKKGFREGRGTMFSQVMRFVKINKPKIIVLENVDHLLKHENRHSFYQIIRDMEIEGYKVTYKVLKCSDYGIPQSRKRLFMVGMKDVKKEEMNTFFQLQEYEKKTTLSEFMGETFEKETAYTIRCGGRHSPIDGKHNWDGYWKITNGVIEEYRLTVRDCLKLQGYENYEFLENQTDNFKMLGNTIPTIFTKIIGMQILKVLNISIIDAVSEGGERIEKLKKVNWRLLRDKLNKLDYKELMEIRDKVFSRSE